jgi:glycosyltransferase involved in cell wall biosynthesis
MLASPQEWPGSGAESLGKPSEGAQIRTSTRVCYAPPEVQRMILTVTLPVYNAMPHLQMAVESVLRQTYQDFDFLIIDDGSTDGSSDYLRSLCDARIKLTIRENRGLGTTLNELFRNSGTPYVARMDSDDVCEPRRLEKQMAILREQRDVVMLGTGIDFIVGSRIVEGFRPLTEHGEIRQRLLQRRPGVNHPTLIVKREAWARVGGYRFAGAGEDLDFCLRICDLGRVTNEPEVLYHYRLSTESLTFKTREETNRGYAFAIACAKARERGVAEPDLEQFRQAWVRRPLYARTAHVLATAGENFYRRSIIRRAQGRSLVSRAYLAAAALCLPHVALSRLAKRSSKPVPRTTLHPLQKS